MGEVVAEALGRDYNKVANFHREGICGERTQEEIGMQTIRGGDIVGEHTVYFIGMGERIELTHRAHTRDMFSRGSVRAAKWVVSAKPGIWDMQDVLGLKYGEMPLLAISAFACGLPCATWRCHASASSLPALTLAQNRRSIVTI